MESLCSNVFVTLLFNYNKFKATHNQYNAFLICFWHPDNIAILRVNVYSSNSKI